MRRDITLWPADFPAAVFDFDGTLCETWRLWERVDRIFFEERGIPYDPSVAGTLNTLGFVGGAQWCVEAFGLDDDPQDVMDEWNRLGAALYEAEARLRPGAADYVRALRESGVHVALATTNVTEVLGRIRHDDVLGLFDAVVCGRDVTRGKDHPDIYLEAARRLGADPRDCVAFEDIPEGVRSARRAGMRAVAVRSDDPRQPLDEMRLDADLAIDGWEGILP